MFLGDPLHPVVIQDDPAVGEDVVGDIDEFELGTHAAGSLYADIPDDLDENRVVTDDILVDVPKLDLGCVGCGGLVQGSDLV